MAESRDLTQIIESFREKTAENERRAKRRIAVTGALCLFVAGYMGWMHSQLSKLDAQAVTEIARAEVEARIPELADNVTQMALDAAPGLMDQGEAAIMRVPSTLRDTVEDKLYERTEGLIDEMTVKLNDGISEAIDPHLETLARSGQDGQPVPLTELMDGLREQYRTKAGSLVAELYVAYAKEIGGVNDYLVHLRDAKDLNEREGIHKEIIHASVAMRQHFVEPLAPVGMTPDQAAE